MWNPVTVAVAQFINRYSSVINTPGIDNPPKRRVLIIHCHPLPESFSTSIANSGKIGLSKAGHDIRLKKLYFHGKNEECYDNQHFLPSLTSIERLDYHNSKLSDLREKKMEKEHEIFMSSSVREAVNDLRWCDAIVFVYPTWWFNFPAPLKGYFDRVFLPGVAFRLPKCDQSTPVNGLVPCLTNIKKVGVITTFRADEMSVFYCGDNGRRFISRGLRSLFAPNCQMLWHGLYAMDSRTDEDRQTFLQKVEKAYSKF